ncbi:unnamed protein product [Rhizoctonia solani]|uniref:Uncharacterized protein n=1 Tax=Rhizoctonia solani TaxID=456999 RepID=A0A8H3E643_9AGAM|nr:unnamed protein product [Rhizoctonia solani]
MVSSSLALRFLLLAGVSLRQSSAGDWVTTANDDGSLEYQQSTPWSIDYESTIWSVDYESTTTITDADGVTRQVYSNCSIHKIFTRRFWTVCDDKTIKIVENEGEEPLPSQLFELKLLDTWFGNEWQDEHHIIRPDTLVPQVVTAPFPNPVRKFYFGTKKIGPRSPILGSISAQLLINASALRRNSRLPEPGSIWFEVAVFSELLSPGDQVTLDQIKSRDGQPLIWVSHELPSRDFHYHMLAGRNLDTGGQPFCESVEEGDYIGVLVRVEQRSTCAVHGGQLRFEVDLQGDLGWRAYDWD